LTKEEIATPAATKTAPVKKLSYKTQRELEEIEKAMPVLEEKKKALENELASGITDFQKIQDLSAQLQKISNELDEKTMRWLEIQEEL
jgi:ATP-binding cassette subfamily F protein uup